MDILSEHILQARVILSLTLDVISNVALCLSLVSAMLQAKSTRCFASPRSLLWRHRELRACVLSMSTSHSSERISFVAEVQYNANQCLARIVLDFQTPDWPTTSVLSCLMRTISYSAYRMLFDRWGGRQDREEDDCTK
jgi:hypothetical protein